MRRYLRLYLLGLALTSVFAFGQEHGPSSNLDAYQAKALENALRQPGAPATREQSFAERYRLPRSSPYAAAPGQSFEVAKVIPKECPIPLTTVRRSAAADPRIQHRLTPEALQIDGQIAREAMPVCPE